MVCRYLSLSLTTRRRDMYTPPTSTLPECVTQMLDDHIVKFYGDLERACEAALQSGDKGVLVKHKDGVDYTITVSDEVPYGHIYEVRP